jgi:hypothetical protein
MNISQLKLRSEKFDSGGGGDDDKTEAACSSGMLTHIHQNRRYWLFFSTGNAQVLCTAGTASDSVHLFVDLPWSSSPLSTRI